MGPENNTENKVSEPKGLTVGKTPKKSHTTALGIILLAILAIGGTGFGVWAWMDGNARVENLNKQKIEALNAQDNKLLDLVKEYESAKEDEEIETDVATDTNTNASVDTNTDTDTDTNTDEDINTADYLYAGSWGLKIKVTDNLKYVQYALLSSSNESFSELCVAGLASRANTTYKFASLYENFPGLACVTRGPSGYTSKDCENTFSLDDHSYCVMSNYPSRYGYSEYEVQLEKDSMKCVVDMLSNPENYSKI